jgi:hypothetical protein
MIDTVNDPRKSMLRCDLQQLIYIGCIYLTFRNDEFIRVLSEALGKT